MTAAAVMGFALGLRHGADPDHLAAIDGLARIRPRATNGIYFALGHGFVVFLLAIGIGGLIAGRFAFLGPWSLIAIGAVNVWRLAVSARPASIAKPVVARPFLLGMLLAAGFETASQLSALVLAGETSAWLLAAAFASGMILLDGLDGYLAASTQRLASIGRAKAETASKLLGVLVVIFAFGLGGAEVWGVEMSSVALPLGLALFVAVLAIRVWARGFAKV